MYIIDQNSSTALHIQLYKAIKNEIIENLSVGEKLASIRKVASTYNLSKNTVESAYRQLYAEGYVESYAKKGYFVSDTNYKSFAQEVDLNKIKQEEKPAYKYDFFPARLSKDTFPLKLYKRLYTKAIDESLDFGAYTDGQGQSGLRQEIAKYLMASRGVKCHSDQIVICNGFADSMGLLAKMVQKKYDSFAMENPGYYVAKTVFEDYGYKIEKIPVNDNGLDLDMLQASKSKIVYITPSHQYPTGVSMPISNRVKLLEWANNVDGIIIEDDYDSELTYKNRPIPSLQGLDTNERVVYLGTFAKSLSPALRVSYMVLPNYLVKKFKTLYEASFAKVSLMTQKTLEIFIKEGHYERHIRKMRTLNRKKHNLLKEELLKRLGSSIKIQAQGGGLAIAINPIGNLNLLKLETLALEKGVKLYFASRTSGGDWEALRMGFGGFTLKEIPEAVKAFAEVYKEVIREK